MLKIEIVISSVILFLFLASSVLGATVIGTKHDLSDGAYPQVCIFCHTPHHANTTVSPPLWNRNISNVTYRVYASATMGTTCSNPPTGVSLLCMSCHDGVNANSNKHTLVIANGVFNASYIGNCQRCHDMLANPSNLLLTIGTDLSNDHPISMPYPNNVEDPFFNTPPDSQRGWGGGSHTDVKLFAGRVECPSCHEPHDSTNTPFLRKSNTGSDLCLTCHIK